VGGRRGGKGFSEKERGVRGRKDSPVVIIPPILTVRRGEKGKKRRSQGKKGGASKNCPVVRPPFYCNSTDSVERGGKKEKRTTGRKKGGEKRGTVRSDQTRIYPAIRFVDPKEEKKKKGGGGGIKRRGKERSLFLETDSPL